MLAASLSLYPGHGLPLLALSLPFYLAPTKLGPMSFSLPELLLLSTLVGAALNGTARRALGRSTPWTCIATPLDRPVALFLGAALLSLLASEVLRVSLRDLRVLVLEPVVAYYMAVWLLDGRTGPLRLTAALLAGGTVASAVGIYQCFFTDHVVAVEGARRILGPYLSPNHLGLYLGRLLPVALAFALFVPSLRLAAAPLVVVLALGILLTFSVGAWLASLLAAVVVVLMWRPRSVIVLIAALGAVAVAGLPLWSAERVVSHLTFSRGTGFIRLQLWDASLRMVRDHPILGVGMDNFLYHYRGSYLPDLAATEPNLSHPHNLVLNFWLQMGVLGVAALAWLALVLGRIWLRLWRAPAPPLARAVLVGLAGAAVDLVAHGMVDNSYFLVDLAYHFWLSAGMLMLLRREELEGRRMAAWRTGSRQARMGLQPARGMQ